MMSFIFVLISMIPLCFYSSFWFNQLVWFLVSFFFIFNFVFSNMFSMISGELGIDLLSYCLILLSFWICSLMIIASEKIYFYRNWSKVFLLVILFLMLSLYLTFSSLNLFVFYIFFEVSLIPTLILIVGWGYQPERLQAGLYLIFYTLLASLPMMISLFFCYSHFCSMHYFFLWEGINSLMIYLLINFVFFVKIPMFFVHLWLPKAHVEAPVSGSMILAGIMLKLGGYGMMRLMVMFTLLGVKINLFFISLSLVGGFYVSLVCLRQSDMKSLIAYSSVSHMGLVLSGIMTLNFWGLGGSLAMMIAHGLCSSGLFCLANISYERLMSRSLYINKGLINLMPSLSLFWFLLVSSNMAAPPSLNLLGEIILINSIVSFSSLNMFFLMLISFFGAVYSLFLYSYSQHGFYYSGYYSFFSCSIREYLLLMLHWLPLNLLVLSSDFMVLWV
uniref:NADH-ubiquinone oxidoreductase chain 4 n=1 Tax=Blaps rhynchoptera TaxID=1379410 RepID=A0A6H1XGY9_BLARH|nr:NADH dehydrogenase subunit 4 [Blaps rhynchoptera]QJA14894.1 NADH dehydrogenase subunit 4 [Blaps rhynchoptera]QJA15164.1 NADH dehydrogenase subunit 4 [Blaps rhynchoptera]